MKVSNLPCHKTTERIVVPEARGPVYNSILIGHWNILTAYQMIILSMPNVLFEPILELLLPLKRLVDHYRPNRVDHRQTNRAPLS